MHCHQDLCCFILNSEHKFRVQNKLWTPKLTKITCGLISDFFVVVFGHITCYMLSTVMVHNQEVGLCHFMCLTNISVCSGCMRGCTEMTRLPRSLYDGATLMVLMFFCLLLVLSFRRLSFNITSVKLGFSVACRLFSCLF